MTKVKLTGLFLSLIFLATACNSQLRTANVGGHKLDLEVAATEATRAQGLSGRDFLADNSGMLFLFESPGKYGFWMKDMKLNLDFIWIKDRKVVEITANVPEGSLQIYQPAQLIDSVIEVNAGWVAKNKIQVGDSVTLDH